MRLGAAASVPAREAVLEDCGHKEARLDDFKLLNPVLVCRWRLATGRLPLKRRHLRALADRFVDGRPLSKPLLGWVSQHLEWNLEEGSRIYHDGVLMIVVDDQGCAAMSAGPYKALDNRSANDLLLRAMDARREAERTGVAPEELWVVEDRVLTCSRFGSPAGCASLVSDIARTFGLEVNEDEGMLARLTREGYTPGLEVFLASDEHGVVVAGDRGGDMAKGFEGYYTTLVNKERSRKRP